MSVPFQRSRDIIADLKMTLIDLDPAKPVPQRKLLQMIEDLGVALDEDRDALTEIQP